jgi:hypothetical protein
MRGGRRSKRIAVKQGFTKGTMVDPKVYFPWKFRDQMTHPGKPIL